MSFISAKCQRTNWYYRFIFGVKKRPCLSCNGSGYYDHNGSPECGSCNGTGKEDFDGYRNKEVNKRQKKIIDELKDKYQDDKLLMACALRTLTNNHLRIQTFKNFSKFEIEEIIKASAFHIANKEMIVDKEIKAYYGKEKQY